MPRAKTLTKPLLPQSAEARLAVGLAGRVGYGARGAVYFLVGVSAAIAAFRPEHRPGGMTETLRPFRHDWAGWSMLALLTLGLACLAGWLAIAGLSRRDHRGIARYMVAAAMLGDAAVYGGFVVILAGFLIGFRQHSGEHEAHLWAAWLFSYAYGRALLGGLGAIVAGCGAGLAVWGAVGDVQGSLNLPRGERRLMQLIGRYGIGGRGVAIALVGGFLFVAALDGDPGEAHELGGMLTALRQHPYGIAAIALFALAFIASSFLDFVIACFRRFDPADP